VVFREALAGGPDAPALLYLQGAGGVGKSALLRRFADEARDAGREVAEIEGGTISPTPAAFAAEAAGVLLSDDAVLLARDPRAAGRI
jgi:hypothetical protein